MEKQLRISDKSDIMGKPVIHRVSNHVPAGPLGYLGYQKKYAKV